MVRLLHAIKRRALRRPAFIDLCILQFRGAVMSAPAPDVDMVVRELRLDDDSAIAELAELGFYTHTVDDVRRRLGAGERCFIALHDGVVVGGYWAVRGKYSDAFLGRELDFDEYFYFLGAITEPSYRGKGVIAHLVSSMWRELASESPNSTAIAFIRSNNSSSLRMVHKMGWEVVGHLWIVELLFGLRVQWISATAPITGANRRLHVGLAPA